MAFHRRVVEWIGYFNPLLGRKGAGRKRSELFEGAETDYFSRLAAAGEARIFYEPQAIVYHQVMPFQLEKRYFRTIHFDAGYQRAYHDDSGTPTVRYEDCAQVTTQAIGLQGRGLAVTRFESSRPFCRALAIVPAASSCAGGIPGHIPSADCQWHSG